MKYTAFISYKSEDREWAQKLKNSLAQRGIKDLYFDQDRLEVGGRWPDQLETALSQSQHIVLLLSKHAYRDSSYVTVEHNEFVYKYYKPAQNDPLLPQRRIVYVLLEGNPPAGLDLHGITVLRDDKRELYAQGAAALKDDDPTWKALVGQVSKTITADENARPVGCFVIAGLRADFEAMDFARPTIGTMTLDAAITKAGLDKTQFLERYGDNPQAWRPFGGDTIEQTLETLKDRVNDKLKAAGAKEVQGLRIRLEMPDDIIWNQDLNVLEQRDQEIARWASQPVIIVIDPLSLCIQKVERVLNVVTRSLLAGGLATVMVLGPRKAPDVNSLLRLVLQSAASDLHRLFEPGFPLVQPQPLAGVNIDDEKEMQRLMVRTVASLFRDASDQAKAEMLRMGPR